MSNKLDFGERFINDRTLVEMRPMLMACAKSKSPSQEMDFWRAEDYGATDDLSPFLQDHLSQQDVATDDSSSLRRASQTFVGDWTAQRRMSAVPSLDRTVYLGAFEKLRALEAYRGRLGDPEAIVGAMKEKR